MCLKKPIANSDIGGDVTDPAGKQEAATDIPTLAVPDQG
jgi:hypothetical protein